MSDEEVQVRFGANVDEVHSAAQQVEEDVHSTGVEAENAERLFNYLGERLLEVFAIHEIVDFIGKISELGEQVEQTIAITALSAEQVQTLGFAMEMTGGNADRVGQTIARLERNMLEAATGTGPAYEAFTRLHISLDQIRNSDPYSMIKLLSDKFEELGPSVQRTADATIIGGRGFIQMAAALGEGSSGLDDMSSKLDETGAKLDDFQAHELELTHQQLTTMGKAAEGVGISIFETLKPAIDDGVKSFTAFLEMLTENVREGGVFSDMLHGIGTAFEILKVSLQVTADVIGDQLAKIIVRLRSASEAAQDFVQLDFKAGEQAWRDGTAEIEEISKESTERIKKQWEDTERTIQQINNPELTVGPRQQGAQGSKGGVGIPGPTTQQIEAAAKQQLAIDEEVTNQQLALARINLQGKRDLLNQEVADHTITKKQELALETQYENQAYEIELDALNKKINLNGLTELQTTKINDQIELLEAKHQDNLTKIAAKGAADQAKEYNSYVKSVESATDQMINGILQGTQTWQQAMGRLFDNLAIKFIDDFVLKSLYAWVEKEINMTAASVAGDTARTTSAIAASTVSAAAEGAAAKTSVSTSASRAAAAVYADVAEIPYIGWLLAPPAAAAAFVAVEAFGSGIASFDVGTNYVPQDGLAMLHQGEAVIPASVQGAPFSGSSASGDEYHITINAVDAQSVASLLKNNASIITNIVQKSTRNFSPNIPAWRAG